MHREASLKNLGEINVNEIEDPESQDKAFSEILNNINASMTVMIDFVDSTNQPIGKKNSAVNAITSMHTALNDLARMYTRNVTKKKVMEDLESKIIAAVSKGTEHTLPSQPPSFVDIVARATSAKTPNSPPIYKRKYKVLIYPSSSNKSMKSSEETKIKLVQGVKPRDLNFQPEKVIKIRNNGILIESSDKNVEKIMDNENIRKLGLMAQLPRKIWPKVMIYDIPSDLEKDEVITAVGNHLEKDVDITNDWCVSATKVGRNGRPNANWVLELSPTACCTCRPHVHWLAVLQGGKLHTGN
jgi:hypothetical protein